MFASITDLESANNHVSSGGSDSSYYNRAKVVVDFYVSFLLSSLELINIIYFVDTFHEQWCTVKCLK